VRAVNKDELDTMLAQLADDAVIDSATAGGKVTKAQYAEVMANVFQKGTLISAAIRDMSVTVHDPSRATVLGTLYLQTRTGRPMGRVEYKLEKRGGRWLIVETNRK
jgi:ketosteroid isomerase-like protein